MGPREIGGLLLALAVLLVMIAFAPDIKDFADKLVNGFGITLPEAPLPFYDFKCVEGSTFYQYPEGYTFSRSVLPDRATEIELYVDKSSGEDVCKIINVTRSHRQGTCLFNEVGEDTGIYSSIANCKTQKENCCRHQQDIRELSVCTETGCNKYPEYQN